MNALLEAVTDPVDWASAQTRRDYPGVLDRYVLDHAEPCGEQLLASDCGSAAREVMDALEARWKGVSVFSRAAEMENDRVRTVMFLIPMLLRSGRPECEAFAEAFRDEWNRRYPKRAFRILPEEEIAAGFRKRPLEFDLKQLFGRKRG
ncbi:MAG: hypothetical protein IJJ92_02310 [Clostridia bacterium]|nr:hypothetical protein [Clostridia bacterium]